MARLQILELPEGAGDDRPPFVLVIDEVATGPDGLPLIGYRDRRDTAALIGARAVLVFEDTIDIPANEITLSGPSEPPVTMLQLGDHEVRNSIADDMNKAREKAGLPTFGQRLVHERTDIARDMDRLAKWKNELTDALGVDRTRDWDDIRNAARGIRKQRDSMSDAIQRVRDLPEQPEAMDAQHPNPTGYLHGYSVAIRAAKRATKEPEPARRSDA